jgi:hypothetical protein
MADECFCKSTESSFSVNVGTTSLSFCLLFGMIRHNKAKCLYTGGKGSVNFGFPQWRFVFAICYFCVYIALHTLYEKISVSLKFAVRDEFACNKISYTNPVVLEENVEFSGILTEHAPNTCQSVWHSSNNPQGSLQYSLTNFSDKKAATSSDNGLLILSA